MEVTVSEALNIGIEAQKNGRILEAKRIYLDIQGLVDASEHELQSNKRYKNFEVESYGVKRWEC